MDKILIAFANSKEDELQNLRKAEIDPQDFARSIGCVKCSVKVAEYQIKKGRFFHLEHPLAASSCSSSGELWELTRTPGVERGVSHMCQFGLLAEDGDGIGLAKNPTKIATNVPSIASALDLQCEGGGA